MLDEQAQFEYRDELHAFVGPPYNGEEWKVPQWVRKFYPLKVVLRQEWLDLERCGEAADWVRGVGEGGEREWVELMERVLRRAEEKKRRTEEAERQRTRL